MGQWVRSKNAIHCTMWSSIGVVFAKEVFTKCFNSFCKFDSLTKLNFQASFLIPPESVSGRMTLLVTLSLVQVSIFNAVTENSPNVEGLSSISAWVLSCILFVFGALVAYALVLLKKNLNPIVSMNFGS